MEPLTAAATPDLRPVMQDLLRLGMDGAAGYSNRVVDQIQVDYIVNPYGRQPPHLLILADGRVERHTPFQTPVAGYAGNVLAVELLGYPQQPPSAAQLAAVAALGVQVKQVLAGRVGFTGHPALVAAAVGSEEHRPAFMTQLGMAMAPVAEQSARVMPATVQQIFDILGTPPERRSPLPPGSLFNTVAKLHLEASNHSAAPRNFVPARTRDIQRLIVVPSHDSFKPEPDMPEAFSLDALRKTDQQLGMSDFRGHLLLAKDGSFIEGRSLEITGNCWPGKNEQSIQIVVAGNGQNPTPEQRAALYAYGVEMRRYYERPLQASVRDVAFADVLLGIDPTGHMKNQLANIEAVNAEGQRTKARA